MRREMSATLHSLDGQYEITKPHSSKTSPRNAGIFLRVISKNRRKSPEKIVKKCKNLKIPVKDTNSEDLGAFIEKDCKFTLKQRITVKYAYENENEQVYFDILKIQSDIEYKI